MFLSLSVAVFRYGFLSLSVTVLRYGFASGVRYVLLAASVSGAPAKASSYSAVVLPLSGTIDR